MLLALSAEWETDVERGPDWLFVKLRGPADGDSQGTPIADNVWSLLQNHLMRRVVLELNDVPVLRSDLIGQLVRLNKQVQEQGGVLRLSGLSPRNQEVLRLSRLDDRFPQYADREAAVMAQQTVKPR